ncbi:MAG: GNAT family N-acetyltransferase [Polyangia bacterium]
MIRADLASAADEPGLRALLRAVPMAGAISMGFERDPDFFCAATIEGDRHETLVLRDLESGRVVGLGSRSVRDAWINGERGRLGYLSQLRIDPAYRGGGLLQAGFAKMLELHRAGDAPFYVTTIIADNQIARRALEKDRPGKPRYQPWAQLVTLALLLGRRRRVPRLPGVELRPATAAELPQLVELLERNQRRFQLAPAWTAADLTDGERCRGLRIEDFLVAVRDGRLVGCLAIWDQQAFKQSVVRGYRGPLRIARPAYNRLAPLVRLPTLPAPGEPVRQAYLSHFAVDGDDAGLGAALVALACDRMARSGLAYLTLGLCEGHPLLQPLRRRFLHIAYRAIVYVCYYPDGEAAVRRLDGRPTHIELAVL